MIPACPTVFMNTAGMRAIDWAKLQPVRCHLFAYFFLDDLYDGRIIVLYISKFKKVES